jgi:hypothetical protein
MTAAAALYLQGGDVQRDCLSRQDVHVTCKRVRDQTNRNTKTAGNSTEAQEAGAAAFTWQLHCAHLTSMGTLGACEENKPTNAFRSKRGLHLHKAPVRAAAGEQNGPRRLMAARQDVGMRFQTAKRFKKKQMLGGDCHLDGGVGVGVGGGGV